MAKVEMYNYKTISEKVREKLNVEGKQIWDIMSKDRKGKNSVWADYREKANIETVKELVELFKKTEKEVRF